MTEPPPEDHKKVVNQTNRGPGTFVGGNFFGYIVNNFAPSHRRTSSDRESRSSLPDDDYDGIGTPLVVSLFLTAACGAGFFRLAIQGKPLGGETHAGWLERSGGGLLFTALFFAALAVLLARAAQGFELWAGRCADLAIDTHVRIFAYPPASMARLLATAAFATATGAAFIAMFFGWSEFGTSIQERAHTARDNAAMNGTRAQAAAPKTEGTHTP
ncbi:hypothetical protein OG393_16535 [Streptomyces sp. NBC_01216]|uniref:hypothetical protein n=1 Tax=Streptomyces sp. NBC_01216 TaxID=2903778 RepID=UPI002E12A64E|nr:hypothetical protein OG393_16535 [Streptomyces sp. NBC_01216]